MKKSNTYKIISIILGLGLFLVVFFLIQEKNRSAELVQELEKTDSEKTQVTADLERMLFQYNDLKTNNDSINTKLDAEQKKIKKLLKELKHVKYSNVIALEQYKKETETLRSIMRSYIVQIDSLNTMNKNLIAENKEVKSQYEAVQEEKSVLLTVTDSLSGRVAQAEQLLLNSVSITGLNKRDRETDKIERIVKFKTCVIIKDNKMAPTGMHMAHIRISMPDKLVLYQSAEDLFTFKGKEIVYTASREFNYTGAELNLCIFYKHLTPQLVPGIYHVDIFIDNEDVGSVSFELK